MDQLLETDRTRVKRLLLLLARPALERINDQEGPNDLDLEEAPLSVLVSAFRIQVGIPQQDDEEKVRTWIRSQAAGDDDDTTEDGDEMEPHCKLDPRGLPKGFSEETYWAEVVRRFENWNTDPAASDEAKAHACYVAGRLIRETYLDPGGPGFEEAFEDAITDGFETTLGKPREDGSRPKIKNAKTYLDVATELRAIKGDHDPITWQGLAYVCDYVI